MNRSRESSRGLHVVGALALTGACSVAAFLGVVWAVAPFENADQSGVDKSLEVFQAVLAVAGVLAALATTAAVLAGRSTRARAYCALALLFTGGWGLLLATAGTGIFL